MGRRKWNRMVNLNNYFLFCFIGKSHSHLQVSQALRDPWVKSLLAKTWGQSHKLFWHKFTYSPLEARSFHSKAKNIAKFTKWSSFPKSVSKLKQKQFHKINPREPYSQHSIYFIYFMGTYKLECYITLGWKGLPGTNTLAFGPICV